MKLDEKVAIITGSGRGIGQTVAVEMAKRGARIIINDLDEDAAQETFTKIKDINGHGHVVIGNVAKTDEVQQLINETIATFGTVDILVNNAQIIKPAMIQNMTDEQWNDVIDIGLKGSFNCIRAVAPIFIEKSKQNPEAPSNGKIINVTSVAGLTGTIGQINYGAAKSGLIGLTMSTAREWGRYNVQSNAVAFGIVETRMTETIRGERFADSYKEKIVLNRFAKQADVAPSILFLASDASNYVTGHVLNVSGGYHIGV